MMAAEAGTSSAGASTSKTPSSKYFEVFINFHGGDSRSTIVHELHGALLRAGIRPFCDDKDDSIRMGEVISKELEEGIKISKIYILIFSKNYASRKWPLRELKMIMECWEASQDQEEEKKKTILPIFYDVDNFDVSTDLELKPGSSYAAALDEHKKELDKDVVEGWETALKKAAKIKGEKLSDYGLNDLMKHIVEEVCRKLWTTSDPKKVPVDYVGIKNPMEDIMKLLNLDAHDVRFVAIHGIGGVGKTTLARLVFKGISSLFGPHVAFLSDIREKSGTDAGIVNLQEELISQLLGVRPSFIRDVDDGVQMIKDRLQCKKVLIVLDDLNKSDQLLKLAGKHSWFGMRSRIIITTRDIGIVPKCEGFYRHKLQEMNTNDALELFSKQVFESDLPPKKYDKISREIVETTGRLPLAINVIAPLFKNNVEDKWVGILRKLQNVVHKDVREKLMISYEQLDNFQKEIFLDIACLFIDKEIGDATYYWRGQGLYPISDIMVLENMSLIEIVDENRLWMHDLLRELGRNLIDEKTKILGKRSRLWNPEEALNVVCRKKGTEEVEALKLGKLDADCEFNHEHFAGLANLRFLELNGGNMTDEDFKKAFSELRWLSWDDCPPEFQATNLCFENLAVLMLSESLITDDWGGWGEIKVAKNLKVLKCTYCRFLRKSLNFSSFPILERLIFKNCGKLKEIDPSIGKLKHLTYLEITNPLIYMLRPPADEYFSYWHEDGEPQILPDSIGCLKSLLVLKLKFVNISELPASIGELLNLKSLCLWCPQVEKLPDSVGNLELLTELDISFMKITKFPEFIINLKSLEVFKCENCPLDRVPDKIKNLMPPPQLDLFSGNDKMRNEILKNK